MLKALVISFFGAIFVAAFFLLYVMGLIDRQRDQMRKKEERERIQKERKEKLMELIAQKEEKEQKKAKAIENAKKRVSGKGKEDGIFDDGVMEAGVDLSVPLEPEVEDQPKVSMESVEIADTPPSQLPQDINEGEGE